MNEQAPTAAPQQQPPDDVLQKPSPTWLNYDSVELQTRLLRRGIEPVTVKGLVRDRQLPEAMAEITDILDRVYLDENDEPIQFEVPIERRTRR